MYSSSYACIDDEIYMNSHNDFIEESEESDDDYLISEYSLTKDYQDSDYVLNVLIPSINKRTIIYKNEFLIKYFSKNIIRMYNFLIKELHKSNIKDIEAQYNIIDALLAEEELPEEFDNVIYIYHSFTLLNDDNGKLYLLNNIRYLMFSFINKILNNKKFTLQKVAGPMKLMVAIAKNYFYENIVYDIVHTHNINECFDIIDENLEYINPDDYSDS